MVKPIACFASTSCKTHPATCTCTVHLTWALAPSPVALCTYVCLHVIRDFPSSFHLFYFIPETGKCSNQWDFDQRERGNRKQLNKPHYTKIFKQPMLIIQHTKKRRKKKDRNQIWICKFKKLKCNLHFWNSK